MLVSFTRSIYFFLNVLYCHQSLIFIFKFVSVISILFDSFKSYLLHQTPITSYYFLLLTGIHYYTNLNYRFMLYFLSINALLIFDYLTSLLVNLHLIGLILLFEDYYINYDLKNLLLGMLHQLLNQCYLDHPCYNFIVKFHSSVY